MLDMSGYDLSDHDIQTVLKHLKEHNPDATEEDAKQLLLKEKMKARNKNLDEAREAIYPDEDQQSGD